MSNRKIPRQRRIGRMIAAAGSAAATLGFFAAVISGPQPADSTITQSPTQSAIPFVSSRSLLNTSGTSAAPSYVSNPTPRLRTRGS